MVFFNCIYFAICILLFLNYLHYIYFFNVFIFWQKKSLPLKPGGGIMDPFQFSFI